MGEDDPITLGDAALRAGRWDEARREFEACLVDTETPAALFGLATALWWLGENRASVERCTRAYSSFRRVGDTAGAIDCALWLAITYKANFDNTAAANGWIRRAETLLGPGDPGPGHAWAWVTRAYRLADLDAAEDLTRRALSVARTAGDVDLELTAGSQLGLIRVAQGDTAAGFALIDEAVAAALGGEVGNLGTVVYACCDMLNACELASDAERAAQWCRVADEFIATYGCPFLYAECRILYGGVLVARGRWDDAERELTTGMRISEGACPALHRRALTRLAALRIRQGRLEDADAILDEAGGRSTADAEVTLSVAALLVARGDGAGAARVLARRWKRLERRRMHLATALDLLVEAELAAGDHRAAAAAAVQLAEVVSAIDSTTVAGLLPAARGRIALAGGDTGTAVDDLERAVEAWATAGLPFEAARARLVLAEAVVADDADAVDAAVDQARRALSALDGLGAAGEADRAAAFLRSLGVVARTGPKGVGVLTAREQDVFRLVASGLSNPEIAARLHISRKTAAHHVSSILGKLHLRNRTEAAAFRATHGDAGN